MEENEEGLENMAALEQGWSRGSVLGPYSCLNWTFSHKLVVQLTAELQVQQVIHIQFIWLGQKQVRWTRSFSVRQVSQCFW